MFLSVRLTMLRPGVPPNMGTPPVAPGEVPAGAAPGAAWAAGSGRTGEPAGRRTIRARPATAAAVRAASNGRREADGFMERFLLSRIVGSLIRRVVFSPEG